MVVASSLDDAKARLAELVAGAERVVGFTGAGISTESGIPDFRSPGGFWTRNAPIHFDDFLRSEDVRIEAWQRKFAIDDAFSGAVPGRGHKALASMVASGRMAAIITQNIDNLHQASGVPDDRIIELHGNGTYASCLSCETRHEIAWVRDRFDASGTVPGCSSCGGLVKTATVSFGQSLPDEATARADAAATTCDLLLAIGSSLVVYPAAMYPMRAKQAGALLVIINRDPTELDSAADLVIRHDIGDVLEAVGEAV